jgi:transposase
LPNDVHTFLTAPNNHDGVTSNEIRLIYVVDKITKLPIYFRYVSGNIIDNSTLITTINSLYAHDINVELIIMDAVFSSKNNILELLSTGISFITRMCRNKKEYKDLIDTHGSDLKQENNVVIYND